MWVYTTQEPGTTINICYCFLFEELRAEKLCEEWHYQILISKYGTIYIPYRACTLQAPLPSVLILRHPKTGFTNAHNSGVVSEAPTLMLSKPGSVHSHSKVREVRAAAPLCTRLSTAPQMASLLPSCPRPSATKHISSEKSTSHCKHQKSQAAKAIWPHPFF